MTMQATVSPPAAAPAQPESRRSLMGRAAVAGAAIAAFGVLNPGNANAATGLTFADIPGNGDIKVLNYALLLEDLERALYNHALFRLFKGGTTALGTKINGLNISNNIVLTALFQYSLVEFEHRNFLNSALGSASILKSAKFKNVEYDFGMQNLTAGQAVNLVYTAERTGVGAYLGAIPKFETKTFLQIAGAIQGTEARHTAGVAQLINLFYNGTLNVAPLANQNNGIDGPIEPDAVLATVAPFIVL